MLHIYVELGSGINIAPAPNAEIVLADAQFFDHINNIRPGTGIHDLIICLCLDQLHRLAAVGELGVHQRRLCQVIIAIG